MSAQMVLEGRGIVSGYGNVEVLHGIDIDVADGEVVALLGPNGAGKTTLLLTLAGMLPVSSGSIGRRGEVLGRSVAAHKLAQRGTMLVAERNLFMRLNVEENLRVGRCDPDHAYELFPALRPLAKRRAGLLSGGEQQMLSLGRALASQPSLLLIDELSLGLAPLIVTHLLSVVRKAADNGLAVILVEQHVARALAVADRAYVLSHGRVVRSGAAAELNADRAELASAYLA